MWFFRFRPEIPFLCKFGKKKKKIQIVSLNWNLVPSLIRICRVQWRGSFFSVSDRKHPLGKLGPKNQSCQFKLKFGTYTNSNTHNSMALFTLSGLDRKTPFWANLLQKIKIVSLSWNLLPTISFIIFWDFSVFYQIFFSPKVKRCAIITYKRGIYELPYKLPNDLRLRKLGNNRKLSKPHRMIA